MSLDDSLAELARVSSKLNDYYEKLNGTIRQAEEAISEAALGNPVWLGEDIEVDEDNPCRIGWAKAGGAWGICVTWEFQEPDEPPIRLSEASRDVRIAAYPYLHRLVTALIQKSERDLAAFEFFDEDKPDSGEGEGASS